MEFKQFENPRLSKKEFPIILDKFICGVTYTIPEIEFEFDLPWEKLKPLLDQNCQYTMIDGKFTLIAKEPEEPKEEEKLDTKESQFFPEIRKIFHIRKKNRYGRIENQYCSISKNKWPAGKEDLLKEGIKRGIILDYPYLKYYMLHKYLRGKNG